MSSTFQRGLFHLVGGMVIPVAALFVPMSLLLVCVGTVTIAVLALSFLAVGDSLAVLNETPISTMN